jgi:acyl-CoA dehydrogenase
MNCSAPDTGNMEVLERVGTEEQKEKWLKPLLNGEIRSAYAMTEPAVVLRRQEHRHPPSCDGDEWVINGEKYYISGAGDPRCKIMIVMVQDQPDAPPHKQQSQILVPMDTPGVKILGPMHRVRPRPRAARPHAHPLQQRAACPSHEHAARRRPRLRDQQVRLGPGRIHHCMRTIGGREGARPDGQARRVARGLRQAAGHLGKQPGDHLAARIEIEAMRLMVLKAAKAMDVLGNREARVWVSMVKAMVPERCCKIIDQAIQMHGATGVSQWSPLADMYADTSAPALRRRSGRSPPHGRRPRRTCRVRDARACDRYLPGQREAACSS